MTPACSPRHPACTTAKSSDESSTKRIGTQSATRIASASPTCEVNDGSALVGSRGAADMSDIGSVHLIHVDDVVGI